MCKNDLASQRIHHNNNIASHICLEAFIYNGLHTLHNKNEMRYFKQVHGN